MKMGTRYTPGENGYEITGSSDIFNRPLYGSHKNDGNSWRFFTFAGDAPIFMGAVTDWKKDNLVAYQEKCGVLCSGLAITPGQRSRFYYSEDIDQTSRWFHNSDDIHAEFTDGHMEYELSQISSWFPHVEVNLEAYPLMPDDGYLVHYRITTEQRVFFTAGFGGLTDIIGRFEMKDEPRRIFSAGDTKGNSVKLGKNRASVTHSDGKIMQVASSFPAEFGLGSAKAMSEPYPSAFLGSSPENDDDCVVKISAAIEPGQVLDGYIVAVFDSDESVIDKWLGMADPVKYIKQQIYSKYACIEVSTPERMLDLTINPTVIALDSSWHDNAFYHGSFAYHAPFLGWRNWYAPTAMGWSDRVSKTIEWYLDYLSKGPVSDERVWYDYSPIPDGQNKFDRRFHHLENPVGQLPSNFNMDGSPSYGPYNMQECALDEMLYYIEWTGNMEFAEKHFDELCSMADWEWRIFDPDDDGLYQNVLNTWISDGHNYNGAGCAQSTAYNYRANLVLAKIAEKTGRDGTLYAERAEKIRKALNEKLWLANEGVIAEYLDTIGNCLIHPSVELPTVYHVMDSDMIDDFKAYRTLKFTENHLRNVVIPSTGGRLCYSSNWLPKQYSNCGIYTAENAHLALMYFKLGLKKEGKKLLDGISGCYFSGRNPGMAAHVQSARGTSDLGDMDFSDVSGMYLRLIVEGLFGIRIDSLEDRVLIAPQFPDEWDHASLELKDIGLHYSRKGSCEIFDIHCGRTEKKCFRIPMRSAEIDAVQIDGEPAEYTVTAAPNNSFIIIETCKSGRFQLRIKHGSGSVPSAEFPGTVLAGSTAVFEIKNGTLKAVKDISETLEDIRIVGNKVYAKAKDIEGDHTLFLRAANGEYDAWLAADYSIEAEEHIECPLEEKPFVPVDMSSYFNCSMTQVHEKAYIEPRPEGYSMGLFQNGRYSHNWNQYARGVAYVDDSFFRKSGGTVVSPSGIAFATPAENDNLACVSVFEVFPTEITVPLSGKGQEIAVLFIAATHCMEAYVENARITVRYADGTSTSTKLVYPLNIDDWLTSALTTKAEIFYFSNFNHATVQRIRIDSGKELESISIEAVANQIVLGVAGISISR